MTISVKFVRTDLSEPTLTVERLGISENKIYLDLLLGKDSVGTLTAPMRTEDGEEIQLEYFPHDEAYFTDFDEFKVFAEAFHEALKKDNESIS